MQQVIGIKSREEWMEGVRRCMRKMKRVERVMMQLWRHKCPGEAAEEVQQDLGVKGAWGRDVRSSSYDLKSRETCGGVKLMSHTVKLWESIVEARLKRTSVSSTMALNQETQPQMFTFQSDGDVCFLTFVFLFPSSCTRHHFSLSLWRRSRLPSDLCHPANGYEHLPSPRFSHLPSVLKCRKHNSKVSVSQNKMRGLLYWRPFCVQAVIEP